MKNSTSAAIVATQHCESYRKTLFYVNNFSLFSVENMVRRETLVSTGKFELAGAVPKGG
jgi:hypothetical protein